MKVDHLAFPFVARGTQALAWLGKVLIANGKDRPDGILWQQSIPVWLSEKGSCNQAVAFPPGSDCDS